MTAGRAGHKAASTQPGDRSTAERPPERTVSASEARARLIGALDSLGLEAVPTRLANGATSTWHCRLIDANGQTPAEAEGLGKGFTDLDAEVGAIAEALEHHLCGPEHTAGQTPAWVQTADLVDGAFAADGFALAIRGEDQRLPAWRFIPLDGSDDGHQLVPVALGQPWYVEHRGRTQRERWGDTSTYERLWRYCSSTGAAVGTSREEAQLHGLNEVIERDALSLFLLRRFVGRARCEGSVTAKTSLPDDVRAGLDEIEARWGVKAIALDITSDIGIPTVLAYASNGQDRWRGVGTSAGATTALRRAVSELAQDLTYQDATGRVPTPPVPEALEPFPALVRCFRFDLDDLLGTAGADLAADADPATVADQLAAVVAALGRAGLRPLGRSVAALEGGVCVEQVVVPGAERFMLVTAGHAISPGARGDRALRAARRAG